MKSTSGLNGYEISGGHILYEIMERGGTGKVQVRSKAINRSAISAELYHF